MFVLISAFGLALLLVLYRQRSTLSFQKRRRRTTIFVVAFAALYQLMVSGLVYFEQTSSISSITSHYDAYVYSIVVLLTRGYSDLFPVTIYGRLLGYGFVLFSVVFYAAVIAGIIQVCYRLRLKIAS